MVVCLHDERLEETSTQEVHRKKWAMKTIKVVGEYVGDINDYTTI